MVYCELTTAQGVLFTTYMQIPKLKEIISDRLAVIGRHLRRMLRDTKRRKYELVEGTETRSLAFVETNAKALKVMVDQIDEQVSTHVALFQQLEWEKDSLETSLEDLETAKEQAIKENDDKHLHHFVIVF